MKPTRSPAPSCASCASCASCSARPRRIAWALAAALCFPGLARAAEPALAEVSSAPAPAPASAPTPGAAVDAVTEQARLHHRRGLELYDEGDHRLALVEFQRAYTIGRNYKILFNIGQVYFQLNSYARARTALEQYLAEGGAAVADKRRAEVERDLVTLRARTATLTVHVDVEGAEITINDASAGIAPLERLLVDAGVLRVQASRTGYPTRMREISLAGGDVQTMNLGMRGEMPNGGGALAGWIITGALAAGAVGTGVAASVAASDYDDMRTSPIAGSTARARADLEGQRDLVSGLALTTDILAVTAIVAAGTSLYLTLAGRRRADAPQVRVQGAGAALRIGF